MTATWTVWIARGGKAWSGEEVWGLVRFWEVGEGKGFLRLGAMGCEVGDGGDIFWQGFAHCVAVAVAVRGVAR